MHEATRLTNRAPVGTLGHMVWMLPRLDPDRRRRRLQLLAQLADAKSVRDRLQPRRLRGDRLREVIASRRRLVG
jgi:hypothetical protein